MNERYIEIQLIENEFQGIIENILGLPWSGTSTSAQSNLGGSMSISMRLADAYRRFKNTEYYFNENSIIHFTNINAAYSILETSKLRLYNLYYKNDKREFTYASQILGDFCKMTESYFYDLKYETETIRFNTYILSATSKMFIKDFWKKEYSWNGKGVGFELSFHNDLDKWEGFYLSPVKYGNLNKLIDLKNNLLALKDRHSNINYKIKLNQIIPFHKEIKWASENEIRLMTFFPHTNKLQVYLDTGDERIKCINLPILSNKFSDSTFKIDKIPFIKIDKIYLGPGLKKAEIEKLEAFIKNNYSYDIKLINYVA